MIVGSGIDIVSLARIGSLYQRHGARFLDKFLTAREMAAVAALAHPVPRLAGRFAAKEAVMKALGTGWAHGVHFRQIEVLSAPSGQPTVMLSGAAAERCAALGGRVWHLSISHEQMMAVALAILET
jgi:holo-[acyl-carrier protein] synthase